MPRIPQHYTAVLTVHESAEVREDRAYPARAGAEPAPTRDVVEVAKVVIRAETLDSLRVKIAAHVALLEA